MPRTRRRCFKPTAGCNDTMMCLFLPARTPDQTSKWTITDHDRCCQPVDIVDTVSKRARGWVVSIPPQVRCSICSLTLSRARGSRPPERSWKSTKRSNGYARTRPTRHRIPSNTKTRSIISASTSELPTVGSCGRSVTHAAIPWLPGYLSNKQRRCPQASKSKPPRLFSAPAAYTSTAWRISRSCARSYSLPMRPRLENIRRALPILLSAK